MSKIKKKKSKNLSKLLFLVVAITFIIVGCGKKVKEIVDNNGDTPKPVPEVKKLKTVDPDSNTRSIAVMINNLDAARPYQSGLQQAYITYEIIVEGGITRMMAVFKDQNVARIGPVRSSRHYYLDYALENDAIYTHFGWSPKAQADISTLGINNINGLYDNGFWRDNLPVAYEHTAFTSTDKIMAVVDKKGYRKTTTQKLLLKYSIDEISIAEKESAMVANNVSIRYSDYMTTSYQYDSENKVYKRFANGKAHTDYVTKEQYTSKNIIVVKVKNFSIDSYGRQDLNNVGTGTGYFITDGYAVPIKWSKASRSAQTVYSYLDGTEITVNDGNTFIQIQPIDEATAITE